VLLVDNNFLIVVGVVGVGGILFDPRGTSIKNLTWGLGITFNNLAKTYALLRGLQIAKEMKVKSLIDIGYSTIVITTMIERSILVNNK
jgi:ribonuclease HI